MGETQISEEEIDSIFDEAKGKGAVPHGGLSPDAAIQVGACTAVTYGNPDQCRHLTEPECRYVSEKLEAKDAGFAKWRPGNCAI